MGILTKFGVKQQFAASFFQKGLTSDLLAKALNPSILKVKVIDIFMHKAPASAFLPDMSLRKQFWSRLPRIDAAINTGMRKAKSFS